MNNRSYYVYIIANKLRSIYVGVTDELVRKVTEYQDQHDLAALVYFEECGEADYAAAREKQIKAWRRAKQIELIESLNPTWADLSSPSFRSS